MLNVSDTDAALAQAAVPLHVDAVTDPIRRSPRSAGILFALLPIAGLAVGTSFGESSAGLVAGIAAAVVLVALFWVLDRR